MNGNDQQLMPNEAREINVDAGHPPNTPLACRVCACLVSPDHAQAHMDWHIRLRAGSETPR